MFSLAQPLLLQATTADSSLGGGVLGALLVELIATQHFYEVRGAVAYLGVGTDSSQSYWTGAHGLRWTNTRSFGASLS